MTLSRDRALPLRGVPINQVVIWGATGQARVLHELLVENGPQLIALFDNDPSVSSPWPEIPLFHGPQGFADWRSSHGDVAQVGCLVAIGGSHGGDRVRIQRDLEAQGLTPIVAKHRTAFVADTVKVGAGSQILAGAIVCTEATLGEACIINTAASVDHECQLGNGVHVCPGAHLAGLVAVDDNVMIGAGAVVLPRVHIGAGAIIGAGAVVTKDVDPGARMVGIPARSMKPSRGI